MLGARSESTSLPAASNLLEKRNHEPLDELVRAQFDRAAHEELFEIVRPHLIDEVQRGLYALHVRSDEIPDRVNRGLAILVDQGFELGQIQFRDQADASSAIDRRCGRLKTPDVVVGVEALTTLTATRRHHTVSALPSPQHGCGKASPLRDDSNRVPGLS